jgi:RNA recognition motif-containing protein
MNIHVANLNINAIESDLHRLFARFGEVKAITIVRDKLNNRSRGRAFVDMPVDLEGRKAVAMLDGSDMMGKTVKVTQVEYDPSFSTHLISEKI